jgi:hypothetical protein
VKQEIDMQRSIMMLAVAVAMFATDAFAQDGILTGRYRCIQSCRPGFELAPAFVTQNGDQLNIVDEAGIGARASLDWFSRKFWVDRWNEGAIYTADGAIIHFDRGRIWQRAYAAEPPVVIPPRRRVTK